MIYIRSAILIICMSLYVQESFGQKRPFSDFANDTMAYLSYNFYLHQESYMGQPLSKFFNDFDLPIKCICLKTNKYNQLFNIEFCTRPASQIRANINNHDYLDECTIMAVFGLEGPMCHYPESIPKTPQIGNVVIIDWDDSYQHALWDYVPDMFYYRFAPK